MSDVSIHAVLFDLDGTLLDTAPDLVGSLNHVRSSEGLSAVDVSEYRQYVSRGAVGLIEAGLPDSGAEIQEERRQRFLSHYAENSCIGTRPFDGVEDLLRELESRAVPWAIVTNKPEYLTLPILEFLGWQRRPAAVICGDTIAQRKPHPAPVLLACELSGVQPAGAMMVGDDPRDLEAAAAAGSLPVLVAYGYGSAEILASGPPAGPVVNTPGELLDLVSDSPATGRF